MKKIQAKELKVGDVFYQESYSRQRYKVVAIDVTKLKWVSLHGANKGASGWWTFSGEVIVVNSADAVVKKIAMLEKRWKKKQEEKIVLARAAERKAEIERETIFTYPGMEESGYVTDAAIENLRRGMPRYFRNRTQT